MKTVLVVLGSRLVVRRVHWNLYFLQHAIADRTKSFGVAPFTEYGAASRAVRNVGYKAFLVGIV